MNIEETIEKAMYAALSGEELDRQMIIDLLGIDPDSETAEKLGECAREGSQRSCRQQGQGLGVDRLCAGDNAPHTAYGNAANGGSRHKQGRHPKAH